MRPLPPTWKLARVIDVPQLNPRRFSLEPSEDQVVSFIPMRSVEEESGRLDASEARPWKEVKKGYTPFEEGDVIFAKITPCMENGKYALANGLIGGRAAGSTEFHVFRPTPKLDRKYLLFFLFSPKVRRSAKLIMRGAAGQLRVPPSFFEDLEIPLPPIDEQQRIVGEIEKQFTRLDAGVASLKRVQTALKRYRASVLKAAFEGPWPEKTLGECFKVERGRFSIRPRNDPRFYGGPYPFVQIGALPREGGRIRNFSQTLNKAGLGVSKMFRSGSVLIAIVGATIGNTGVLTFDACAPDSIVAL
jgi:type I restriction modification DNA specificity protein